jgi:hypothetical protein
LTVRYQTDRTSASSLIRIADHFALSENLYRVAKEMIVTSVSVPLTGILESEGDFFASFTQTRLESSNPWGSKGDNDLTSFVFMLKNPHNIRTKRFVLKTETKHKATECV